MDAAELAASESPTGEGGETVVDDGGRGKSGSSGARRLGFSPLGQRTRALKLPYYRTEQKGEEVEGRVGERRKEDEDSGAEADDEISARSESVMVGVAPSIHNPSPLYVCTCASSFMQLAMWA